jgi:hypothetical protein
MAKVVSTEELLPSQQLQEPAEVSVASESIIELAPQQKSEAAHGYVDSIATEAQINRVANDLKTIVRRTRRRHESPFPDSNMLFVTLPFMAMHFTAATIALKNGALIGEGELANAIYAFSAGVSSSFHGDNGRATVPNGFGLQVLHAEQDSKDGQIRKNDVAVVVVPLASDGNQKPEAAQETREQLRVALEVASQAGADKVIIPEDLLAKARAGIRGKALFGEVVQGMSKIELTIPAANQKCLVAHSDTAKLLAERLRQPSGRWDTIRKALQTRYPFDQKIATAAPEDVLPALHGYVRNAANERLLGSVTKKFYAPGDTIVIPADATRPKKGQNATTETSANMPQIKSGKIPDVIITRGNFLQNISVSTYNEISAKEDPYDPKIFQHASGQLDLVGTKLSRLVAENGLPTGIALNKIYEKIDAGQTVESDLELLFAALQTIRDISAADQIQPRLEPRAELSGKPEFIGVADKFELTKRRATRILLRSLIVASVVLPASNYADELKPADTVQNVSMQPNNGISSGIGADGAGSTADAPVWKVDRHGLADDGYYAVDLYDKFIPELKRWDDSDEYSGESVKVILPMNLPNNNEPHITLSQWSNDGSYKLPVAHGTRIAALRVTDEQGKPVKHKLWQFNDGVYYMNVLDEQKVQVSYDLVRTKELTVHADKHADLGKGFNAQAVDPSLVSIARHRGPQGLADYIHNSFTYVNQPEINAEEIPGTDDAALIANGIAKGRRVICNMDATEMEIVMAAARPRVKLAFTTGYSLTHVSKYLYERHAWVTGADGRIYEAQPDAPLSLGTAQNLDSLWQAQLPKQSEHHRKLPDPTLPLAALGAAALITLEFRQGYVRRSIKSAARAVPGAITQIGLPHADSYRLLSYAVYGRDGKNRGTPPDISGPSSLQPRWSNVQGQTALEDVAKKGLPEAKLNWRQRRALRRTAKLAGKILAKHDNENKAWIPGEDLDEL